MAYQDSSFADMRLVNGEAIINAIADYYPNANQKGGTQRLALLKKATNLDELIDFCIDGYRAWGDAVLMGAGAYLKITDYPDEIFEAKKYVKQEVYNYLSGEPFLSANDYDAWHKNICLTLSDRQKYFASYSAYRQTSKDKFKNRDGFTIGNAQKFLNMLMKDLYACLSIDSSFLKNHETYFTYCHMPLDSYILQFVDDIRQSEKIKKPARKYTWSNMNKYEFYMDEQTDIRDHVAKYVPGFTALQTEFVIWRLIKEAKSNHGK